MHGQLMQTDKRDGMKNAAISTASALLLLAATGAAQNMQVQTFSFGTGFSVSSASNTQLRATVGEAVVGITKGSTFAIGSGFLVDSLVGRMTTKVIDLGTIPRVYALMQNFPNPFNPTTTIRYEVPKAGKISLKIFNTLGQLVATLADEHKETGYYQVLWNANVASGIYFYRLQAGEFVGTKKMILLR
jgi:hypothetical protein